MTGVLKAIALRPARFAAMAEVEHAHIEKDGGLKGDHAGARPDRLVSMLSWESWAAACADLNPPADPETELPWLTRRANLLVDGVRLPRAAGGVLRVGDAVLEITQQTYPCKRMEEARPGLLKALAKEWRGGVLCKVQRAGKVSLNASVDILVAPDESVARLP